MGQSSTCVSAMLEQELISLNVGLCSPILHRGGGQCNETNPRRRRQQIKPKGLIPEIALDFLSRHCDASVESYSI